MDRMGSDRSGAEQSPRASDKKPEEETPKRIFPNLLNSELYTVEQVRASPSRKHGISEVLEDDYRRKTCLFIKAAGKALDLPVEAIATALVYFHKFFMLHSFRDHERFVVASACVFLAAKVEESGKRVDEVVTKSHGVWTNWEPFEREKPFKRLREKILIAERCVLHTISFRMSVEHPYSLVLELLKMLFETGRGADKSRGSVDKALNRRIRQAAQSFVNDSLLTTLCLQYRPFDVAAAVVYLTYLFVGLPRLDTAQLCLRRGENGVLQTDEFVVGAICDTILSLYDEHGAGHATVLASSLREALQKRMNMSPTATTAAPSSSTTTTPSPRPTPSPSPQTPGGGSSGGSAPAAATYSGVSGGTRDPRCDIVVGNTAGSNTERGVEASIAASSSAQHDHIRTNAAADPLSGSGDEGVSGPARPNEDEKGGGRGSGGVTPQLSSTDAGPGSTTEKRKHSEYKGPNTTSTDSRATGVEDTRGGETRADTERYAKGDPRQHRTSSSSKESPSLGSAKRKRKSSCDIKDRGIAVQEGGGEGVFSSRQEEDAELGTVGKIQKSL